MKKAERARGKNNKIKGTAKIREEREKLKEQRGKDKEDSK